MPAKVKKSGKKFRVVEPSGKVLKNSKGRPVDGGGHVSKDMAESQARAINANAEINQ